jgi:molecular chaperone GrpE (heat shock protein)
MTQALFDDDDEHIPPPFSLKQPSRAKPARQEPTNALAAIRESLETLDATIGKLGTLLKRQAKDMTATKDAVTALTQRQDVLEAAGRELERLSDQHFHEHVITPLVSRLLPPIDLIGGFLLQDPATVTVQSSLEMHAGVREQLIEFLGDYSVELFHAAPGTPWDKKTQRAEVFVPTPLQSNHHVIVRTIRCGVMRNAQILRPAVVSVYRFDACSDPLSQTQKEK